MKRRNALKKVGATKQNLQAIKVISVEDDNIEDNADDEEEGKEEVEEIR